MIPATSSTRCATGFATRCRAWASRSSPSVTAAPRPTTRPRTSCCMRCISRSTVSTRSSTRKLTQDEREKLRELFTRRIEERIPAAYLTHEAWLGDFRFYVDERVIIPRSFIAELIPGATRALRGPADGREDGARHVHGLGMPRDPDGARLRRRRHRRRRHLVRCARGRAAQRERLQPRRAHQPHPVGPLREPAREELRPRHLQSAVRRRDGDGDAARTSTATSRSSRSPAARTVSTPCACS